MITKTTIYPGLSSSGMFDSSATRGFQSSYFEGSDDGTTYAPILTIKNEPPQVGNL